MVKVNNVEFVSGEIFVYAEGKEEPVKISGTGNYSKILHYYEYGEFPYKYPAYHISVFIDAIQYWFRKNWKEIIIHEGCKYEDGNGLWSREEHYAKLPDGSSYLINTDKHTLLLRNG